MFDKPRQAPGPDSDVFPSGASREPAMSRDQDQDFYRIGPPDDGGRDRNVGRYDERGYDRDLDRGYDRGFRDYEHPNFRRPEQQRPYTDPAAELSGTDWVMCVLCPGVACLVGLVRTVSGNP